MDDTTLDTIICPGCGWIGAIAKASSPNRDCPSCGYENNLPPYRLLTLKEMLENRDGEYDGVRMDAFLAALFRVLAAP